MPAVAFPFRLRVELLQELLERPALAREEILTTLGDVRPNLGVLEFEVVLELVNVHDAGDGDPVLLEDA